MDYENGPFYGGYPNGGYTPWNNGGNNFDAMVARENLKRAAVRDLRMNSRAVSGTLFGFLALPVALSMLFVFRDLLNDYYDNPTFRACADIVFSIVSVFLCGTLGSAAGETVFRTADAPFGLCRLDALHGFQLYF